MAQRELDLQREQQQQLLQQQETDMAKNNKSQHRKARRAATQAQRTSVRIGVSPASKKGKGKAPRVADTVKLRDKVLHGLANPYAGCHICPVSGLVIQDGQGFYVPTKSPKDVNSVLPPPEYINALQQRSLQGPFASPAAAATAIALNTMLTPEEKAALLENVEAFYNCHRQSLELSVAKGITAYYNRDTVGLKAAFAPTETDLLNVGGIVTFANSGRGKKKAKGSASTSSDDESAIPLLPGDAPLDEPLVVPEGLTVEELAGVFQQADEALLGGQ